MVSTVIAVEYYDVMWCNDIGRKDTVFSGQLAHGNLNVEDVTFSLHPYICFKYENGINKLVAPCRMTQLIPTVLGAKDYTC